MDPLGGRADAFFSFALHGPGQPLSNEHDAVGRARPDPMLPYSQHAPAQAGKRPAISRVSRTVQAGLLAPILHVRFWASVAAWASMPEAPINKDGEPPPREDEIRGSWKARVVQPPSAKRAPGES